MKAIFILITTLMIGSVGPNNYIKEISANCDAELSVEKNENSKSASENGTEFILILKNTSISTATYTLSSSNLQEPCENITKQSSGINVSLITAFEFNNSSASQNEITLNSGQSIKFIVKVNVPLDASSYDWGCIEIEAQAIGCNSSDTKTILNIYVPGP